MNCSQPGEFSFGVQTFVGVNQMGRSACAPSLASKGSLPKNGRSDRHDKGLIARKDFRILWDPSAGAGGGGIVIQMSGLGALSRCLGSLKIRHSFRIAAEI